jgi:HTH-type transcriptional regulator, global nitrogen regulator NrpRI
MVLDDVIKLPKNRVSQFSAADTEHKIISILRVLSESMESLGSITIGRELKRYGIDLSERAIRYHLRIIDERGYTQNLGRNGRAITPKGMEELKLALAPHQVGFILDKLELLAFETTFDPEKKVGLVPANISIVNKCDYSKAFSCMKDTIKAGLSVSHLVSVIDERQKIGSTIIPAGKVGIATICSVVVNGVLLKAGIPINSRFGGVLEIQGSIPTRFVAIISYEGTSLDPSVQYIRSGMTNVGQAAKFGYGKILANFRDIPGPARSLAEKKLSQMKDAGINGVAALGNTSQSVCQMAVGVNRVGMIMLGGLNPAAAVAEQGIEIENIPESGLIEYTQLKSIWDL